MIGQDATDDKEFEKRIAKELTRAFLTKILSEGIIDKKKADDIDYIRSVIKEELKECELKINNVVMIHNNFLEFAKDAIDKKEPMIALVLIATAVEQIINCY